MKTLELTDEELQLFLDAVRSHLGDLGREEADVLRSVDREASGLQRLTTKETWPTALP